MTTKIATEKPRKVRHAAQRLEILEAAAAAIAEHGFHGMTMRGLARATNRGLATFYNYFSSKEEVLFSLQTEAFETMTTSVRAALENVTDPSDRLYVFVLNHLHFLAARRAVMRVLVHEAAALPAGYRKTVRRLKEAYFNICRDIVAAILAAGGDVPDGDGRFDPVEIERFTYSVFGMLNWSYGWYEARLHGTPQDVAKTIHALAVSGLVGHRPPGHAPSPSEPRAAGKPILAASQGGDAGAANKQLSAEERGRDGGRARAHKAFEQETV